MHTLIETTTIQELIRNRELTELGRVLGELTAGEVADLLDELPISDATVAFRLLGKGVAVEVFDELESGSQAALIESLGAQDISDVFSALDPEEQAWLLDEVPAKVAKSIQTSLSSGQLNRANILLGYAAGSVGRRMSPQAVSCHPDELISQVHRRIQASTADMDRLAVIPVISASRRLLGVVSLLDISRAVGSNGFAQHELEQDAPTIATIMKTDYLSALTYQNAEIVARDALDEGALVVPVVDGENRLVGVLPIADAARIDREAVAEDQARQGGAEPLQRPYLVSSVFRVARSRIVWLLVLALSAVLTVHVLEMFEATLAEVVALALFVPLLTGIGGNTGSQAATTVTRAIGLGDVISKDVAKVAFKEMRTGAVLGVVLAALAFAIATPLYSLDIGLTIGLTLLVNCPIAATVGGVIPLVARACKVDPAVFSTPFISTFCDATGLLVYFTIARTVMGL